MRSCSSSSVHLPYPLPAFVELQASPVAGVSGDSGDAEIGGDGVDGVKPLVLGCASADCLGCHNPAKTAVVGAKVL